MHLLIHCVKHMTFSLKLITSVTCVIEPISPLMKVLIRSSNIVKGYVDFVLFLLLNVLRPPFWTLTLG